MARSVTVGEITVEPITVWAPFGTFILGMFVGVLVVYSEAKRARRRWREAIRTWREIETVAVELRDEHKDLPRHDAPAMAAAIRDALREEFKKGEARKKSLAADAANGDPPRLADFE
jgi:hypothetical protein